LVEEHKVDLFFLFNVLGGSFHVDGAVVQDGFSGITDAFVDC
jgi:hypothetical protein